MRDFRSFVQQHVAAEQAVERRAQHGGDDGPEPAQQADGQRDEGLGRFRGGRGVGCSVHGRRMNPDNRFNKTNLFTTLVK